MAARSRITVLLLLFLLSTEHSFAVNLNELTPLVKELYRAYRVENMFSLAVSIPLNQNQNQDQNQINNQNQNQNQNQGTYRIQEVLDSDPADKVKKKINEDEVYVGSRVVEAKRLERGNVVDHAESRVLDELSQLYKSPPFNPDDLLLFYVYASPCDDKCTNPNHQGNILSKINNIRHWKNWAVVFSKIFKPKVGSANTNKNSEAPITARRKSLDQLATYPVKPKKLKLGSIGLKNIFRCDLENDQMQCVSCSSNGQVAHRCVSDDPPKIKCPKPTPDPEGFIIQGKGRGDRVRRDISCNTGDSSSQISKGKVSKGKGGKGGKGNVRGGKGEKEKGRGAKGGKEGKGGKGKGRGKGEKGGKGGKGEKGGKGGRGGKGEKGRKGEKGGKGGRGGKGKGSRRGGGRRRGLDQDWIFVSDF